MARSSVSGPASVVNVFVNVSKLEVSGSRGSRSMHDVNYNHYLSLFSTNGSLTLVEVPSGLLGAAIEIQKEPRRRRFRVRTSLNWDGCASLQHVTQLRVRMSGAAVGVITSRPDGLGPSACAAV